MAPKEPVIDDIDASDIDNVNIRPSDVFPTRTIKVEPVIDWEGLTQDLNQFYNEAWNDGVESSAVYEKATVHIPEERISQFLNRPPNYLKPGNGQPTADTSDSNQNSFT